jgi:hypothetical protein
MRVGVGMGVEKMGTERREVGIEIGLEEYVQMVELQLMGL